VIPISKPFIGENEKQAVLDVLDSGMLVQGPITKELETRFADVCGTRYAVATSSGTTALFLACLAHGIRTGDEIITTPFTFIASVNSIILAGGRPIFVDIEEDTFNIDPSLIEGVITPKTKAIMPVHLYGYPCNMGAILEIANRHGLFVIEDAAQAVGADYKGRSVGSFGTGCFSLYATKNITSGEGGMITTDDESIARRCRMLRNHGMQQRYHHEMLGYNFRMSDLHAAIALAQIDRLPDFTKARRKNAAYLNANIKSVIVPEVKDGFGHVWHQYTVRVQLGQDRDAAVRQLNGAGIGTGIFYPVPVHKQEYILNMGLCQFSMPVAERLAEVVFSLPVHPQLSQVDLETIVAEVNKLL